MRASASSWETQAHGSGAGEAVTQAEGAKQHGIWHEGRGRVRGRGEGGGKRGSGGWCCLVSVPKAAGVLLQQLQSLCVLRGGSCPACMSHSGPAHVRNEALQCADVTAACRRSGGRAGAVQRTAGQEAQARGGSGGSGDCCGGGARSRRGRTGPGAVSRRCRRGVPGRAAVVAAVQASHRFRFGRTDSRRMPRWSWTAAAS